MEFQKWRRSINSGIPKVEGVWWEVEFQKWVWVVFGGCILAGVLAVNFGGSIWRVAWRPPRARSAREKMGFFAIFVKNRGYFCHLLWKIVRKLVKVNKIVGIFVMILVISEFVEKKIEIWKVLRASFGQSLHFLKFFFFSCQILTQFFQIFKHFELFANKNRKNRR